MWPTGPRIESEGDGGWRGGLGTKELMRRLILLRHGKTERASSSGRDFDRALTARGRADARLMGRVLAGRGLRVDRALVSAAARAVQTWDEAGPAFPGAEVEVTRALYEADAAEVLSLAQAEPAECVLVVGHNPGLHELAQSLAARDPQEEAVRRTLQAGLPTAAAAVFGFGDDGAVTVEGVFSPREFGGGAEG